ncbi:transposase [Limnoraphis robusta Tam1]|uniref:Transposase n=1 Tax=Limnoraphis robusta CCNP1315 TaxID=3110306 RepID=A0ABU5U4T5_9CYAN|nr:transposase [Limnoraphis robusta]MEA5501147.1 transposase [Limnoraphis robusta BA-68 BA1]MEA5522164.1 transposase [Limnoraphis robusta CCNP1315]MEA5542042.1 transposase [Limnoraphis robusta Tam1]MEA5544272.1 transposase [Limnoraphis robusta CCNP1324]
MLVCELKLKAHKHQFAAVDEAIRTGQFIRNKCLRYWMDAPKEEKVNRFSLNKYCKILAAHPEYPFVAKLNSMARQSMAERAWLSISRFFNNCKGKVLGKKGYPKFKKFSRSVEYKTSGWKLSEDRKTLTITDQTGIGKLKLVGSRDLNSYQKEQIKRIRLVRRADGYYAQFCIDVERKESVEFTGRQIGLDVGLNHFYTDSEGNQIENPRYLRKSEKGLKRLQKRLSRKHKRGQTQSKRYHKNRAKLGRKHLKISRQRKDFVVKLARCVVQSNDLIAYEDLSVKNMVKNHCLAKSISDAGWTQFREGLEYFAQLFEKQVVAVAPNYTSQDCSNCGQRVKKSLSVRTHVCSCGTVLDRDENAARNILNLALKILSGGQESTLRERRTEAIDKET